MRRLTVSFTDEQFAWVQEQADERDRPKKWVIQQAVDAARGEESSYGDMVPPGDTSTDQAAPGDTSTHQRLDELEQRLADLEDAVANADSRPSSERAQPSPEHEPPGEGDTSDVADDHTGSASADAEAALQELGLPGSGDVLEARRETVGEMYSLIRERNGDTVRTSELKDLIDPDRVGYGSVDSFWSNAVKGDSGKGRVNALTALPGVRELGNGRYQYHDSTA